MRQDKITNNPEIFEALDRLDEFVSEFSDLYTSREAIGLLRQVERFAEAKRQHYMHSLGMVVKQRKMALRRPESR